ncbi:MAG: ROK family protein [Victivallaceae bacterium]|nr:ROK family protein [Victivallaceae bacterium]
MNHSEQKKTGRNPRLELLRLLMDSGPLEQPEAARLLGITKAGCNLHFQRLIAEKYLEPVPSAPPSGRGRPAMKWHPASNNLFCGVLLNRTGIALEAVDFRGERCFTATERFSGGGDAAEVCRKLDDVVAEASEKGIVRCIFVGIPGGIDANGTVTSSPNFPAVNNFNAEAHLRKKFAVRAYSDTMALAIERSETCRFAREEVTLLLDWSEGIGIRFLLGDAPFMLGVPDAGRYRGLWDYGHTRAVPGGRRCHCGKRGCLEAYIGGVPLLEQHPELGCATVEDFAGKIAANDPAAEHVFIEAVELLAQQIRHDIELFGVRNLVLFGGMRPAFPVFASHLTRGLGRFFEPEELASLRILPGGTVPPEHGAALVARDCFFTPSRILRHRGLGQEVIPPEQCVNREDFTIFK